MEPMKDPAHPGEILLEEFLQPLDLTQAAFLRHLDGAMTQSQLNEIINGKRGITPHTAEIFSLAFGTSMEFWLNLQAMYDIAHREPLKNPIARVAAGG